MKLVLTYEDLYNSVARFLHKQQPAKFYEDITNRTSDPQTTVIKDIVARGYRQFLYPISDNTGKEHLWSFLKQYLTINLLPNKWKYALPENFSEMLTDPSFSDEDGYYSLTKITPEQLIDLRVGSVECVVPSFYTITTSNYDLETGTFYEFWVHGEPGSSYTLQFFYKIDPLKPESTTHYLVGGIKATEAIMENCYAVAEQQELNVIGIHTQLAHKLIQDLIKVDVGQETKTVLGNLFSGDFESGYVRGDNSKFSLTNLYSGEGTTFTEP